jgi:putative flippase GtrA
MKMNKIKELLKKYKFLKFLIVGGSSTCIDFVIYMVISNFIPISISKSISMTISCIYSFFINRNWTFQDKNGKTSKQVLLYVITQIFNILTNVGTNQLVYSITNIKIVAYVFATLIAMIVNYIMQKKLYSRGKNNEIFYSRAML